MAIILDNANTPITFTGQFKTFTTNDPSPVARRMGSTLDVAITFTGQINTFTCTNNICTPS